MFESFKSINGFCNVIGAVDGCQFPMPGANGTISTLIGKALLPSMNKLLLDLTCRYVLLTFFGRPGKMHNARVSEIH